MALYRHS